MHSILSYSRIAFAWSIAALLAGTGAFAQTARPLSTGHLTIDGGQSRTLTFKTDRAGRTLLWVRARLAGPEQTHETPAYVLKLSFDGRALSPDNARVLNKEAIDAWKSDKRKAVTAAPLFKDGAWGLRKDTDYNYGAATKGQRLYVLRPYLSHYYEYLIDLGKTDAGTHKVTLSAAIPAGSDATQIDVAKVQIVSTDQPFVLYAQDWMQPVFPWQAPGLDQVLTGDQPLRRAACRGEYEPITFSVYSLGNKISALNVNVSALDGPNGARISAKDIDLFFIEAHKRKSLGEARFIARMPFVPERWARYSPELLIPLSETRPAVDAGLSRRFYVDVKTPAKTPAGTYRGTITLQSGDQTLAHIAFEFEVLPFDLAKARTDYWMWRLTWNDMWDPKAMANFRDIKAHGFTGMVRSNGSLFKLHRNKDGSFTVDGTDYRKAIAALRKVGLSTSLRDDSIDESALRAAAGGIDWQGKGHVGGHWMADYLIAKGEPGLWKEVHRTPPTPEQIAKVKGLRLPKGVSAEEALAHIRRGMLDIFKQISRITHKEVGEGGYAVFPTDEPDGDSWQRVWTRFVCDLAHEAGLKTWSTRNTLSWPAHLDENAFGSVINRAYYPPEIRSAPYLGELRFRPIPMIAAFRDGAKYHSAGDIDEVRIYNRALSDREILQQAESPADKGLLAYYSFNGGVIDGKVRDESGHGHTMTVHGTPYAVEGHQGKAMHFDGIDDDLRPPKLFPRSDKHPDGVDVSKGWSISLWFRGGAKFGYGYDFYTESVGKLRYTTTEQDKKWYRGGGFGSGRFWQHITYVFDPETHLIKSYIRNKKLTDYRREHVRWCYVQVRAMPPGNYRYKTGYMAFLYANLGQLTNMTAFCYDWNTSHLYIAYPKDGKRWSDTWYRTLGEEGVREGIDDARYLQTLCNLVMKQDGIDRAQAAHRIEKQVLDDVGVDYDLTKMVYQLGGYNAMRGRVIKAILKLRQ